MPDRDTFEDLPILGELRHLLGAHMRDAATAGTAPPDLPRRGPGWAATGLRRVGLALAVAVALAVVAVGLVVLHHGGAARHPAINPTAPPNHPSPGPSPAVTSQLNRAQRQTIAHDPACQTHANRGPTIDHGSPGPSMLSRLAVLRRPPLAPDPTTKVLNHLGWDAGAGVYVNYIRRARTAYGRSYWIVPEARTTPFAPIPARCYRELRAALVRDLRHVTPALRAEALRAQHAQLSVQRLQSEHRQGVCFIEIGLHVHPHPGAVGFGCSGAPFGPGPFVAGNGSGARGGATIESGVVVDGILWVSVRYGASAQHPARTFTSAVINNVYVIKIPSGMTHAVGHWSARKADGRTVPLAGEPERVMSG